VNIEDVGHALDFFLVILGTRGSGEAGCTRRHKLDQIEKGYGIMRMGTDFARV
jgi:hypothetical protein